MQDPLCFQASWCDMCSPLSLSLNSDTTLWAWLNKSWKYDALMLKSLPRSTSSMKKGYPNVRLTQSFWKSALFQNPNHDGFDLNMNYHRLNFLFLSVRVNDYHRLNFLFLSVHVNAIWTLKSNFGAGSMNASFCFQGFQSSENQSVNLFATVPPIAVVQVQDHRPQQPQTSPAALRKDHIEKSSHSACWSPPSSLKWCCTFRTWKVEQAILCSLHDSKLAFNIRQRSLMSEKAFLEETWGLQRMHHS